MGKYNPPNEKKKDAKMKLTGRHFEKDGAGSLGLIAENAEDMWHAYNLIQVGDSLKAPTVRKVTQETATGSTNSYRVSTNLTIEVDAINYDTQAGTLHVKGRNIVENPHVKLGQFHTLDLEVNRKFTISKEVWDSIHIERIASACDPAQSADLAAVIMQEGLAHVCLITANMTLVRAKVELSIPRKRKGYTAQHEKGLARFFDQVGTALVRHLNLDVVKCVLVASPGFVKDQFTEHFFAAAAKEGNKVLLEAKGKFLLVHSSSGFKHSLNEVLADPAVAARLADTKAAGEVKALAAFNETLELEPERAYYGIDHVEAANDAQAIATLLVSDALFRSLDIAERRRYVRLVESVREQGAAVLLFSSLHSTGQQLTLLSGVAAILRFPMPEIDEEPED